VQANYLASPPLVVAYALAGTVDIDLMNEPLGQNENGDLVYLKDIWPTADEVLSVIEDVITPEMFKKEYEGIETSNDTWNHIKTPEGSIYAWDEASTYIQEPPFFWSLTPETPSIKPIMRARVLIKAGDSTTTDHISPAGAIPPEGPAGTYLIGKGVQPLDFNSFGSRRGNHEVMMRGTFANIRFKNQLVPGTEGGVTRYLPTDEVKPIYEASLLYQEKGTQLIVLAGKDYGMGSSRDWAAKGTALLGVRAVIAESYERIHRSNLIGMGVLPLQFVEGESPSTLDLDGSETFDIPVDESMQPRQEVVVTVTKTDGTEMTITTRCRLDTPIEIEYYRHGGILHYVLRDFVSVP